MANPTFSALVTELREIMATGTDEQARAFIVDHINDFPENVRDDIALALFEEALRANAADLEEIEAFQTDALQEAKEIEAAKQTLGDKRKMMEIKKDL